MRLLTSLGGEFGTTVVQVTHSELNALAGDRIIRIADGMIAEDSRSAAGVSFSAGNAEGMGSKSGMPSRITFFPSRCEKACGATRITPSSKSFRRTGP